MGEVPRPAPNVSKATTGAGSAGVAKGKEKAKEKFDGVVLKKGTTATTVRAPLRSTSAVPTTVVSVAKTVAAAISRKTRSGTAASKEQHPAQLEEVREEPEDIDGHDDNAMAVDHPVVVPVPAPRRFTAARSAITHTIASRSQVTAPAARRAPPRHIPKPDVDEAESNRVFKKRRTSSDAPEEAVQAEEEHAVKPEEQEADPQGDEWDDLDAEDADDPLMVSEYVVEIFNYLKEVEVRRYFQCYPSYPCCNSLHLCTASNDAEPLLYGISKRPCVENARHLD